MYVKPFILSSVLLLFESSAQAVIYPNTPKTFKAIIKLESATAGVCTGAVIGLNPPTVITARHCIETGTFLFEKTNPYDIFTENFNGQHFSTQEARLPGDVAILVYPRSAEKYFKTLTEQDLFDVNPPPVLPGQELYLCGFGAMTFEEIGGQHCGLSLMFGKTAAFQSAPDSAQSFQGLSSASKAQYIYDLTLRHELEYGPRTRLSVAALLPIKESPFYKYDSDHKLALTQWGDSGGPVFVINDAGQKQIVSITSASLSSNFPYGSGVFLGAYSWRLDHPWTREFLKKAFYKGADIKGFL
jgi:hypothetical protein